jgi:hypothetical protein
VRRQETGMFRAINGLIRLKLLDMFILQYADEEETWLHHHPLNLPKLHSIKWRFGCNFNSEIVQFIVACRFGLNSEIANTDMDGLQVEHAA